MWVGEMSIKLKDEDKALADRYKRLRRIAVSLLGYDRIAEYWHQKEIDERICVLAIMEANPKKSTP